MRPRLDDLGHEEETSAREVGREKVADLEESLEEGFDAVQRLILLQGLEQQVEEQRLLGRRAERGVQALLVQGRVESERKGLKQILKPVL